MRPAVSIFTPTHDARWLDDCYASLRRQTRQDWQWVVGLNNGAQWTAPEDPRVAVHTIGAVPGVGAAKAAVIDLCDAPILVELDHDDTLVSTALNQVVTAATEQPNAALIYSDCAEVDANLGRRDTRFDEANGWNYYDTDVDGTTVLGLRSLAPTPHNVSYIWWAPNHVRAFPRWAYDAAGGYDRSRIVCDDADLMSRLYQAGPFHHLRDVLYLQRVHGRNTQANPVLNAEIQRQTVELYDRHIQANTLAWAARAGLHALDLGAAHGKPGGYLGVDAHPGPGVDVVRDVRHGLPFDDNSVGVIRAVDFLEHLPLGEPVGFLQECWRVLAPGGLLLTLTPSTDGRGAFCDPTHVSFWNELSFRYYTDRQFASYLPGYAARFQTSRLATLYPSPWHEANNVPYVCANLIAVKDGGERNGGVLLI